jgi:hypothetical protein
MGSFTGWRRGRLGAVLLAVAVTGAFWVAAPSASAQAGTNTLRANESLTTGQQLVSATGQYATTLQGDGNLVLVGNNCALWASGTSGSGAGDQLAMQGDGNLVLYNAAGRALWSSKTAGSGGADYVVQQDDGNLVLFNGSGAVLWASNTSNPPGLCYGGSLAAGRSLYSHNGAYRLTLQGDGNLVETTLSSGAVRWAAGTAGTGATALNMQSDGLVLVNGAGAEVWWVHFPVSGCTLYILDDGHLEVVDVLHHLRWYV